VLCRPQPGLWVPPIRPPTVPVGTSRLRVTLSAAPSDEDVTRLLHGVDLHVRNREWLQVRDVLRAATVPGQEHDLAALVSPDGLGALSGRHRGRPFMDGGGSTRARSRALVAPPAAVPEFRR
jgi:hypothetical protein